MNVCSKCAIELVEDTYFLPGCGGIQRLVFNSLMQSNFNRKKKKSLKANKKLFNKLLIKYKFQCVNCGK